MHIAMYADRPASFGGIETHVATLAGELARLGQRVTVAFPRVLHPEVFAGAVARGVRLAALDKRGLAELCRRDRPTLLHAHSHGAYLAAAQVHRALGIPWVATLHGPDQPLPAAAGPPAAVICVSREIARSLPRSLRAVVIENGVDLTRFNPARREAAPGGGRLRAVYLGRVGPSKVQGLLALQEALGSRPDVELRFVSTWAPGGAGRPSGCVEEELAAADLVFSTGRGVREAMACGCAAFVLGAYFDGLVTPSNVDLLAECNFSGRATRRRPTAGRLTVELLPLLRRPDELTRLGRFGAEHAARAWDARAFARQTLETYLTAVS